MTWFLLSSVLDEIVMRIKFVLKEWSAVIKRKCIFCGKSEEELINGNSWSTEHIIPLSLGNTKLKTKDVCANCNNKLGQYVDKYFVDNMIIAMKRNELGLKGESGKTPNPFKKGVDQFGNTILVDDSFNTSIVTSLKHDASDEGIQFKGSAPNKDEAKSIVSKSLKRMGYDHTIINTALQQIDGINPHIYQPIISYEFSIEPNRFSLFFLKVAYEYACLKLGDNYWNDKVGIEIRETLCSAISGKMESTCANIKWAHIIPDEIAECFKIADNSGLNIHMIFLHAAKEGKLICEVFLFLKQITSYSIIVSEHAELYAPLPPIDIIEIHSSKQHNL